jgi:hypothetical protein
MLSDTPDFVERLRSSLPKRWFAPEAATVGSLLSSLASSWEYLYGLLQYVLIQSRISTATGPWLDLASLDYLGHRLPRRASEPDLNYSGRIRGAILQEAASRSAVLGGIEALVGTPPSIFEPANCGDTGGYGGGELWGDQGVAYGASGGWGNLAIPYEFFITVHRPPSAGVGMLSGFGCSEGGFGSGVAAYGDLSLVATQATDTDIRNGLLALIPLQATAWLRII